MGWGDVLKEIGDAAQYIPVIGSYVAFGEDKAGYHPKGHTSKAIESAFEASHAKPGLETTMSAMNWLYDNGVSQPLTTAMLQGRRSDFSDFFSAHEWSRAWRAAEHISPGQAYFMADPFGYHVPGTDRDKAEKAINSPLTYYVPPALARSQDFQNLSEEDRQAYLREQGMPAVGNAYIEGMRRDSQFFKYASGSLDFAARWYLDPVVLGGKGAGLLRNKYLVNPRPAGGWSHSEIAEMVDSSKMSRARRFMWENKDNPALINNLTMVQKSAMGPRFAHVLSKLKSEDEVRDFLLVSLGDVPARARLEARNTEVAQALQRDTARLPELGLAASRVAGHSNPRAQTMIQQRMDQLNQQIRDNTRLHDRYQGMLDHYGELDALNTTRFSGGRAARRTRAQSEYVAGAGHTPSEGSRLGMTKLASDYYGNGLTIVRSFKNAHPNGLIKIDDLHPESIDELRGHVARIPGLKAPERQDLLNRYMKTTTEGERLDLLEEVGQLGAEKIALKHGLDPEDGMSVYREGRRRAKIEQARMVQRYSGAKFPDEAVHVDEFMDEGGKLVVHPNLVTKLANNHVMMDLDEFDKVLARHGSALKALRRGAGEVFDMAVDAADWFNHIWKLGTLFRMGYIPRVLADDLAGQVARLGAANMALRAGWGVKNLATNLALRNPSRAAAAGEAVAREGVKYADQELALIRPEAERLRSKAQPREEIDRSALTAARDRHRRAVNRMNALGPDASQAKVSAHQRLVDKHKTAVGAAEQALKNRRVQPTDRLAQMDDQIRFLEESKAENLAKIDEAKQVQQRGFRQRSQLYREPEVNGVKLPPALAGERGEYFAKMVSADDSLRNLFETNKRMLQGNMARAYDKSGVAISYPQSPTEFVAAWEKAINHMIMQDGLASRAVHGESIEDMTRWLNNTPAGRAYRKRLGLAHTSNDRIAASAWHEVDSYLPTPEIKAAAQSGEANIEFLTEAASQGKRPFQVHTTDLGESLAGTNNVSRLMDRISDTWFKVAASIPADKMSRHPLFNQLYEGHARQLVAQEAKQGQRFTTADVDRITTTARRMALRDTRKLVFDIAHRSDVGHALRFISPFFSATTEAWQRWARIIADKPQTVGYAGLFFNVPASLGWMQDRDGNPIQRDGTVIDPVTGKKKLVKKNDRMITVRVPDFIAKGPVGKALGMRGGDFLISQDSMNLVTQGDPWFVPGTGPIVQIPVNEWVRDKPSQAELARHLGVLPFGPETSSMFGDNPVGRAAYMATPSTIKNFLTAFDTSDDRYQRIKLQIMQKAAFEHAHLGKPMPSAQKIADMTRDYWLKSAAWSFFQPAATQRTDAYEFYRQQYRNLSRQDFKTADEKFLDRYGPDYFTFAQATSKGAAPSTKAAVALSKKWASEIAENPELAALIIGPNGKGPFSPEAYAYQLTTPLVPGGAEAQRTKLSASEAMQENERRLGWARFGKAMHYITAQLHDAGFDSFTQEGAEQFNQMKRNLVTLLGEAPELPNGQKNPFYNEQWSKDYFQMDPRKYERLIPNLEKVAYSPIAKEPLRSDLRKLQTYLEGRKAITQALAERSAEGGAKTLSAKANADMAAVWAQFVDGLIESDTRFGDLYYRYLSRDLGVDVEMMAGEEVA